MSGNYDHAQRVLERKALESVRSLVDKVEAEDRNRTDEAVAFAAKVLGVVLVVLALAASVASPIREWMRPTPYPTKPTRHAALVIEPEPSIRGLEVR